MKRLGVLFLLPWVISTTTGCNTVTRQPAIESAAITPSELGPGDSAIISVEIQDRFNIVERVEGVVAEDSSITFKLRDDGVSPDAKAQDDIWTLQVDVPFNAPPGDFEFSLTAYNSEGQAVLIRNAEGEVNPLTAKFGLVIVYPQKP